MKRILLYFFILGNVAFSQNPRWRTLPGAPAQGRQEDVFFVNESTGWVANSNGQVWKTTNGGAIWMLQWDTTDYFRSVGFADSMLGWIGTLDSVRVLHQTTDGGASWSLVQDIPQPRPAGICGISVVNDSVVYASGRYSGSPRVIKTTDRGTTWTSIDLTQHAGALVDCYFFSPDSGFVVGSTSSSISTGFSKVLFTSDGGNTWSSRHTGSRAGELCWKIQFETQSVGYVSIEKFTAGATYYLKTTDAGNTWNDMLFFNYHYDVQGIGFVSDSLGWIGGWGGDTYETNDAGSSWHPAGFGTIINRFRFLSDTLAYAVGQTVYKYSIDSTVNVPPSLSALPTKYRLEQNYPNPFNPRTTIQFTIPHSLFTSLKIYNVLGQEVATLVYDVKQRGRHHLDWDAISLASGMYFYRLVTKDFTQTRTMLLLK